MDSQGLELAESRSLGGSPPTSHIDLTQAAPPQSSDTGALGRQGEGAGSGRGGVGGSAVQTLAGAAKAVAAGIGGIVGSTGGGQDGGEGADAAQQLLRSRPAESSGTDGDATGGPGATSRRLLHPSGVIAWCWIVARRPATHNRLQYFLMHIVSHLKINAALNRASVHKGQNSLPLSACLTMKPGSGP